MLSFCTLFSLSQAADKSLLSDLIENAHSIIIAVSLILQNTVSAV